MQSGKMKFIMRFIILCEFIFIAYGIYILRLPRADIEDTHEKFFKDQIVLLLHYPVKDRIIQNELSVVYDDIAVEIDSAKDKQIDFVSHIGEVYELSLYDYITVDDVKISGQELQGFDVEFNYLSDKKDKEEIKLVTSLDSEAYTTDVVNHYIAFNEAMQRPSFEFRDGALHNTDSGKAGRELNTEKLAEETLALLSSYDKAGSYLGTIEVLYNDIPVYPSIEDINNVNTRISSFSTGYSSSGSTRKTNIAVATRNTSGTFIAPGETVSVDKLFKSRNAANGYQKAGSYLNGRTVQTYGGGVCQVSSTLYGAVIRAGLVPVERNAHSMAVSYVPLGLDAAISEGVKDLKIKNTYDTPIYITGYADGSIVTFNVYGKADLLDGYTYQPGSSSSKSGLYANSWLNKMKDGVVVEKINLFESNYRPH